MWRNLLNIWNAWFLFKIELFWWDLNDKTYRACVYLTTCIWIIYSKCYWSLNKLRTTPEKEHSPPTLTKVQPLVSARPAYNASEIRGPQSARSNGTDLYVVGAYLKQENEITNCIAICDFSTYVMLHQYQT